MIRLLFSLSIIFLSFHLSLADDTVKAKLDSCISYYQDGEYQKAVDSIKAIIPLISDKRDEAEAYKYIGFSYVMLDMINKAKDFFKVALEKFPELMIDTLEVPPNITVVFKQTKLEKQMEQGDLVEKDKMGSRPVIAAMFGTVGVVSGAVGGYFLYKGLKSRQAYKGLESAPKEQFNLEWNNFIRQTLIGSTLIGFAGATGVTAFSLLRKKPSTQKPHATLDIGADRIAVTWNF